MDRRSFVASVLGTITTTPFFNLGDIFKDEIRSRVEQGVQKLGLGWSANDVDALTEEIKDVIADRTDHIQKEVEDLRSENPQWKDFSQELEYRLGKLHNFVEKKVDEFLAFWKKNAEKNGFLDKGYVEVRDSSFVPEGQIGNMKRNKKAVIDRQKAARKKRLNG